MAIYEDRRGRLDKAIAAAQPSTRQVGGTHYTAMPIQPWDAMEAWMGREQFIGFLRGGAIKYLARAGSKGDAAEDVAKAGHYIEKLAEVLGRG